MKQDVSPSLDKEDDEMEVTIDNMTTDIVEDFARQLDQVVRLQQQDEDDEQDEDGFGYQQLPQEEEDMYQPLESDEEEEDEQIETVDIQGPLDIEIDPSTRLNPETSDLIKSIMTNIQLSNDAIPEWAKKVPESAWLPRVSK